MNKMPKEIQAISEKVELLHESSNRMIDVMERQIEAIISSNTNQIEELANLHSTLTIRYTENEQDFIEELSAILSSNKEAKGLKLIALKEMFPAYAKQIEYWQSILHANVSRLQQKHHQVVELLEFAMNNNAKMLETLYSKSTEKNKHYGPTGTTQSVMPGLSLNQQA
ncbi:MAG: flagellar export chaperone FlgN [Balneolaceae bacterium]|nr:flagellar export chaperone FlgN [Balneolaceae bacterium]